MSNNFRYFHPSDNIVANATVTTGGAADSAYPLTNATDFGYANLANPAKLTGDTGDFIFDFGSAQRIDAAMVWHDFDASLACAWQANSTNSWPGSLSTSLTVPSKHSNNYTVKIFTDFTNNVTGYTTAGKRFWRLNVSGTNSVPVGVKVMLFQRIRTTTRNYKWSYGVDLANASIDMTTDALVPWAYDLTAAPRVFTAPIIPTDADVTLLQEWFLACAGRVKPTVIVPDPTTNEAWLVRWANGPASIISPSVGVQHFANTRVSHNYNTSQIMFEEITAGDPEWY